MTKRVRAVDRAKLIEWLRMRANRVEAQAAREATNHGRYSVAAKLMAFADTAKEIAGYLDDSDWMACRAARKAGT